MPACGHDAIAQRRHIVAAVVMLDGVSLTPAALARVARGHEAVALAPAARERNAAAARAVAELLARGEPLYGASTGVGALSGRDVAERRAARCGCCAAMPPAPGRCSAMTSCARRWRRAPTRSARAARASRRRCSTRSCEALNDGVDAVRPRAMARWAPGT